MNTSSSPLVRAALYLVLAKQSGARDAARFLMDLSEPPRSFTEFRGAWRERFPESPLDSERLWGVTEDILVRHAVEGVHVIDLGSEHYPPALRLITDPPLILFMRGDRDALVLQPNVAIVGTRQATQHGLTIATRIASFMAETGWTVVSGLALGIDAAAHSGALEARGRTIAVLAHGLHEASPPRNRELAAMILDRGGGWVSEHPLGVPPSRPQFVARNRIQIGLSAGSIIVEADLRSGSMAQAHYCVREHRPLFAVVPADDPDPLRLNSAGTRDMVKRLGAFAVHSKDDYPKMLALLSEKLKELPHGELRGQVQLTLPVNRATRA